MVLKSTIKIRLVSEKAKYLCLVLYLECFLCLDFLLLLLSFYQVLINAVAILEKFKREILDSCANDACDAMTRLVFGKSPLPSNGNVT